MSNLNFQAATTEQLIEAGYTVKKLRPAAGKKRTARKGKRQGDAFWHCVKAF